MEKKTIKNMVYRGLYSYRQLVRVITLFPNICFVFFLHVERVCKSFWKESLTRTRRLFAKTERVHFQVRVGVFNCQQILQRFFRYLWYCGKKQIECGLAWSVLLSPTIHVITLVKICCGLTRRGLVSPQHLTTLACEQAHLFGNWTPAKPARRMRRGHILLFARDTLTNEWACS